jgi:hypothetical protein
MADNYAPLSQADMVALKAIAEGNVATPEQAAPTTECEGRFADVFRSVEVT